MPEHYGLYYDSTVRGFLFELNYALSLVLPCLNFKDGKCSIATSSSKPSMLGCIGSDCSCPYYTVKAEYLDKDKTVSSNYITTQHVLELLSLYIKLSSTDLTEQDNPLAKLLDRGLFGSDGTIGYTEDGCKIVLPQRTTLDEVLDVITKPVSVESSTMSEYLDFVMAKVLKLVIPYVVFPFKEDSGVYLSTIPTFIGVFASCTSGRVYYLYKHPVLAQKISSLFNDYLSTFNDDIYKQYYDSISEFLMRLHELGGHPFDDLGVASDGILYGELTPNTNGDTVLLLEITDIKGVHYYVLSQAFSVPINLIYNPLYYSLGANNVFDLQVDNTITSKEVDYDRTNPAFQPEVNGLDMVVGIAFSGLRDGIGLAMHALPSLIDVSSTFKSLWYLDCDGTKSFSDTVKYGDSYLGDLFVIKVVGSVVIIEYMNPCFMFIALEATVSFGDGYAVYTPSMVGGSFLPTAVKQSIVKSLSPATLSEDIFTNIPTNMCVCRIDNCSGDITLDSVDITIKYVSINNPKIAFFKDQVKVKTLLYPESTSDLLAVDPISKCDNMGVVSLRPEAPFFSYIYDCEIPYTQFLGNNYVPSDVSNILFLFVYAPKYNDISNIVLSNIKDDYIFSGYYPTVDTDMLSIPQVYYLHDTLFNFRSFIAHNWYMCSNFIDFIIGGTGFYSGEVGGLGQDINVQGLYGLSDYALGLSYSVLFSIVDTYKYAFQSCADIDDIEHTSYGRLKITFDPFYTYDLIKTKAAYKYVAGKIKDHKESVPDPDLKKIPYFLRLFSLPQYGFIPYTDIDFSDEWLRAVYSTISLETTLNQDNPLVLFCIYNIGKFTQQYVLSISVGGSVKNVVLTFPVIVRQLGMPDLDIQYRWKSEYDIYTYLYNGSGLNPFEIGSISNQEIYFNPIFYVVYNQYRLEGTAVANPEYGLLFNSWWPLKMDPGMLIKTPALAVSDNIVTRLADWEIDVSSTTVWFGGSFWLGGLMGGGLFGDYSYDKFDFIDNSIYVKKLNIGDYSLVGGFDNFKQFSTFELGSVSYVYDTFCGDHDFVISNVTPWTYGRGSNMPFKYDGMSYSNEEGNDLLYDIFYHQENTKGILAGRTMPFNRLVGKMWFPYRSCEVARYNETLDWANVLWDFSSDGKKIAYNMGPSFKCFDLIFKPDKNNSDFYSAFIDDYSGVFNFYRYVPISNFEFRTMMAFEGGLHITTTSVSTEALTGCGVSRSMPLLIDDKYVIGIEGVVEESIDNYSYYIPVTSNFKSTISLGGLYEMVFDCATTTVQQKSYLKDVASRFNYIPHNYRLSYSIAGFERARMGDVNFIYQVIYPFYKRGLYSTMFCVSEYGNGGEDIYGTDYSKYLIPMTDSYINDVWSVIASPWVSVDDFPINYAGRGTREVHKDMQVSEYYAELYLQLFFCSIHYDFSKYSWEYVCGTLRPDTSELKTFFSAYKRHGEPYLAFFALDMDYSGSPRGCVKIGSETGDFDSGFSAENVSMVLHSDTRDDVGDVVSTYHYKHIVSQPLEAAVLESTNHDFVPLGATLGSSGEGAHNGTLYCFIDKEELYDKYLPFVYNKDTKSPSNELIVKSHVKGVRAPVFGCLGAEFMLWYVSLTYGHVASMAKGPYWFTRDSAGNLDHPFICSGDLYPDAGLPNNYEYVWLPISGDLVVPVYKGEFNVFTTLSLSLNDRGNKYQCSFLDYVNFVDVYFYSVDSSSWEVKFSSMFPLLVFLDYNVSTYDKLNITYSNLAVNCDLPEVIVGTTKVVDPVLFGSSISINVIVPNYNRGILNNNTVVFSVEIDGEEAVSGKLVLTVLQNKRVFSYNSDLLGYNIIIGIKGSQLYIGNSDRGVLYDIFGDVDTLLNEEFTVDYRGFIKGVISGFIFNLSRFGSVENDQLYTLLPYTSSTLRSIFLANDLGECVDGEHYILFDSGYACFPIGFTGTVQVDEANIVSNTGGDEIIGFLFAYLPYAVDVGEISKDYLYNEMFDILDPSTRGFVLVGYVVGTNITKQGNYYNMTLKIRYKSYFNTLRYNTDKYIFNTTGMAINVSDDFMLEIGHFTEGTIFEAECTNNSSLKALVLEGTVNTGVTLSLFNGGLGEDLVDAIQKYGDFIGAFGGGVIVVHKSDLCGTQKASWIEDGNVVIGAICSSPDDVDMCLYEYISGVEESMFLELYGVKLTSAICYMYGFYPLPAWYAPGHRLDIYEDVSIPLPCNFPVALGRSMGLTSDGLPSGLGEYLDYLWEPYYFAHFISPSATEAHIKEKKHDNGDISYYLDVCSLMKESVASDSTLSSAGLFGNPKCTSDWWGTKKITGNCVSLECYHRGSIKYLDKCMTSINRYKLGDFKLGYTVKTRGRGSYYNVPTVAFFATHVAHGVYGYPRVTPVS